MSEMGRIGEDGTVCLSFASQFQDVRGRIRVPRLDAHAASSHEVSYAAASTEQDRSDVLDAEELVEQAVAERTPSLQRTLSRAECSTWQESPTDTTAGSRLGVADRRRGSLVRAHSRSSCESNQQNGPTSQQQMHPSSVREAAWPDVNIVYSVEVGLSLCSRFSMLKNLQFACLCANRIACLDPLAALPQLQVLDASDNAIQYIVGSDKAHPAEFQSLKILILLRNLVRRASALHGLASAKHLRAIFLKGNIVAKDEYYRQGCFSAVPSLLAIDGHPKIPHDFFIMPSAAEDQTVDPELAALARESDRESTQHHTSLISVHSNPMHRNRHDPHSTLDTEQDFKMMILRARNPRHEDRELMLGWALNKFLMRCKLNLPMIFTTLNSNSTPADFARARDETVSAVHALYAACNPGLVIQRCLRGHWGRKHFRKYRIQIMMPTVAMQRMIHAKRISRQLSELLEQPAEQTEEEVKSVLRGLQFASDGSVYENQLSPSDLYFLPEDVVEMVRILKAVRPIFPDGMFPILQASNLVLHRSSGGTIARWVPFFQVIVSREFRQRSIEDACRLSRIPHGLNSTLSPVTITRRGMSTNTMQKASFVKSYVNEHTSTVEWHRQHVRPDSNHMGLRRRYLLVLRFNSQHSRGLFIRVLRICRSKMPLPPPIFVLQETVTKMLATCTIQCAVRSWLQRRRMNPPLRTAVAYHRATRTIQSWWRWQLLLLRVQVLSRVHQAFIQNGEATVLYCFAANMKKRFDEDKGSILPFREGKFHFDFDDKMQIFVHSPVADSRPYLPKWMQSGADMPRRSEGNVTDLKNVLKVGCPPIELVDTQGGAEWRSGDDGDQPHYWKIPHRQLLGSTPVLRLTFPSVLEAQRRTAILLIRTFRPRGRDPVLLVNAESAAKHVHATYIQAVFRGFLVRRWWHLLGKFVNGRLQTTFLQERQLIARNLKEYALETNLWQSLPSNLQQVFEALGISARALSAALSQPENALSARLPKNKLSRDGHKFPHAEKMPQAIMSSTGMMVARPATAEHGCGSGLPGDMVSKEGKKVFGDSLRRARQDEQNVRWVMQMSKIKRNTELISDESERAKKLKQMRSKPEAFNLRAFDILQPRSSRRGNSVEELEQIHSRIKTQKECQSRIRRLNDDARSEYIDRKRRERSKERRVAVYARQIQSELPLRPFSVMETPATLPELRDMSKLSDPVPDRGWTLMLNAKTDMDGHVQSMRASRMVKSSDVPILITRTVDKIVTKRAQSAANLELEARKTKALQSRTQIANSILQSRSEIAERKRAQVIFQRHTTEAMRTQRFSLDDKWKDWAQEKAVSRAQSACTNATLSRPVTPHIDLRASTPGAWRRLDRRQFGNGMRNQQATSKNTLKAAERGSTPPSMWFTQTHGVGIAKHDLVQQKSMENVVSPSLEFSRLAVPGAQQPDNVDEERIKDPMGEERPLSAAARDQLLNTSGIVMKLRQTDDFLYSLEPTPKSAKEKATEMEHRV